MTKPQSSAYIDEQRREYSLYVMQMRAIPSAADGLKLAARRVLWTARNGHKYKAAVLAASTMPIHPHATPESAVNSLAGRYVNNIPLLRPYGAFGTLLHPTDYGASRYTSVQLSKFTQDVVLRDIDIVPMQENYDSTLIEPVHFLPLIPIALLNPAEGIAVGFATNILPRLLEDIIIMQLAHLKGAKNISEPLPKFSPKGAAVPYTSASYLREETERGVAFYFTGKYESIDATTIKITQLPYGMLHGKALNKLDDLIEKGIVIDYDDHSKDRINIIVKVKRGQLSSKTAEEVESLLGLNNRHIENMNLVDFTGRSILPTDAVSFARMFTDWRLEWYVKRYQRLKDELSADLQRYYDVRKAITNNAGAVARKCDSRDEFKEWLHLQLAIKNLDYIADLPVYRFTEEERLKNEEKITKAIAQLKEYDELLSSEPKRRKVYSSELEEVLKNYMKGTYNE